MRRFWLRDTGDLGLFARRFSGSDDIFSKYSSSKSINFITAHDGFNLQDLVSYNLKHNFANGEHNQDGHNENHSNNHGIEGETSDNLVKNQREITACALLATLLLSSGVPMLFSGDEMGHSQQGNNNCYCQDNEITWLNWENANQARIDYVAELISLRKKIPLLSQQNQWWHTHSVRWLNPSSQPMDISHWHDNKRKELAILLQDEWLIFVNAKQQSQQFILPQGSWRVILGQKHGTLMTDTQSVTLNNMGVCVLQKSDVFHSKILETQHA